MEEKGAILQPKKYTAKTTQTVTYLRNNKKWEDAFALARELLEDEPDNEWNHRAMGWLGLDMLKFGAIGPCDMAGWLQRFTALNIPYKDAVYYEQLQWRLGKYLFGLHETKAAALEPLLVALLRRLPSQSGLSRTFLLKSFLKHKRAWLRPDVLVEVWGWDSFRPDDESEEILPNGKKLPSLVERTHIMVARWLLHTEGAEVSVFIDRMNTLLKKHPDWPYIAYYLALLLRKERRIKDALDVFVPFARTRKGDFWVWETLSDLHPHDPEMRIACLARALCCKVSDDFLVKIRQKFAGLLIDRNQWAEARCEIQKLISARQNKNWSMPSEVTTWIKNSEYLAASILADNSVLYNTYKGKADELLLDVSDAYYAIIWKVNTEKGTAQFYVSDQINGGFSFVRLGIGVSVGQAVQLWLTRKKGEVGVFWQVTAAKCTDDLQEGNQQKPFSGILQRRGNIGFVGDVFVPNSMAGVVSHGQRVRGRAIKSFNHLKNTWVWVAFTLQEDVTFKNNVTLN